MNPLQTWLSSLPIQRVLDLATGSGNFIRLLLPVLDHTVEIIGLDANESAGTAFAAAFHDQANVRFQLGDVQTANFAPASFDLITIANSLHHFEQPQLVLTRALHWLRHGGHLLIAEMYCDAQTPTQQTHVLLHHWWAAIDRKHGIVHQPTFTRQALLTQIAELGLTDLRLYDECDLSNDPKDPGLLAELNTVFERYLQRAEGFPDLIAEGHALQERVQQIGFHSATTLLMIGTKP